MQLAVLYEDYHLIAVNKPAGLLTQGVPQLSPIPTLEALVKDYIKVKYEKPAGVYLGIPHRLDRPVSGVVVFARNTKAAQRIAAQFQAHRVRKTYWAVLAGHLPAASGRWEDWLRKIPEEARTVLASEGEPGAKLAVLDYRVLAYLGQPTAAATAAAATASTATAADATTTATLVEFTPQTGRMHQLRVQSASRGFPILGDELYGCTRPFGPPAESPRDRLIALHAASICLEHPTLHAALTITAPLPDYWQALGLPLSLLAPDRAAAIDWPKYG